MAAGISILPQQRLEQLLAGYERAVARRRHQSFAVLGVLVVLVLVAGHYGEVDLGNLLRHLSGLTSYFGRILPRLRPEYLSGDIADWYWNALGWLKLLFDTVLIAYLATLAGTIGAGLLAFVTAANLAPSNAVRWFVKRLLEFCRTVPDLVFALISSAPLGWDPWPACWRSASTASGR